MRVNDLSIPKSALINFLKNIPEKEMMDIFSTVMIKYDYSPLTEDDKRKIIKAKKEYSSGKTVKWEDIK